MYTRKDGTVLNNNQLIALGLAETGVRNSILEDLHAGITPESATGDFSDVKVVTPFGEIPWNEISRISDEEMKRLMIDIVDRIYSMIDQNSLAPSPFLRAINHWKAPELHEEYRDQRLSRCPRDHKI